MYDPTLPCKLYTDASEQGLGAILAQKHPDGRERVVSYFSKRLNPTQSRYNTTELECFAIIEAVRHFNNYLDKPFQTVTDHSALKWLLNHKNPGGRLFRWSMELSSRSFTIIHRAGGQQTHVDALSRNPVCTFITEDKMKIAQQQDLRFVKNPQIKSGIVTIRIRGHSNTVVSDSLRAKCFHHFHDDFGHPGKNKTLKLISTYLLVATNAQDHKRHFKSKPWFDRECYLTKKALKSQLKIYIRSNSEGDRKAYALLKKKYSSLLTGKKKTYYIKIQEKLKEVRDSASFWKTISLFKNRRTTLGNISIQKWQQFYTELLATSPPVKYDLSIRVILMPDDELMAEISLSEITGEIAHLKRNKACGLDNIPNEAIKALPQAYLTALKDIYNRVLKTGQFPTTWCKTIIHPIFKNGDTDNPHNYRGIALLSNLAKLFSSILKIRLSNWTENKAIIPENQAGFRKEYSCQDHIFTLVSLIQLTLRRKRRKFYAFFIDLKKAFDTVPQALLWKKLLDIGLNFRFINLIKNY
ncbi:hypothetical protein LAZ67_2005384 [Cordylochernes scorpioides]|uniref:Reverse transcriptase domain-containing protein n=1 Tax=Cordylochernes scorpioides TaxID=51811 RepID=A0ABY6K7K8_9ARAC|nr:hypothetical protein LAZ67_2005384 [Cordylochernes scorpioides]